MNTSVLLYPTDWKGHTLFAFSMIIFSLIIRKQKPKITCGCTSLRFNSTAHKYMLFRRHACVHVLFIFFFNLLHNLKKQSYTYHMLNFLKLASKTTKTSSFVSVPCAWVQEIHSLEPNRKQCCIKHNKLHSITHLSI